MTPREPRFENVRQDAQSGRIYVLARMPDDTWACLEQLARGDRDEVEAMFFGNDAPELDAEDCELSAEELAEEIGKGV